MKKNKSKRSLKFEEVGCYTEVNLANKSDHPYTALNMGKLVSFRKTIKCKSIEKTAISNFLNTVLEKLTPCLTFWFTSPQFYQNITNYTLSFRPV